MMGGMCVQSIKAIRTTISKFICCWWNIITKAMAVVGHIIWSYTTLSTSLRLLIYCYHGDLSACVYKVSRPYVLLSAKRCFIA